MTSHIFVGPTVSKKEEWLNTSIGIATSIFLSSGRLKVLPPIIRPIAALFDPDLRRIGQYHENAQRILLPEIFQRRKKAGWNESNIDPGLDKVPDVKALDDMIDWLDEDSNEGGSDPLSIVRRQLGLCFASVHTTTNHVTNVLFDLAARWDTYGHMLRQEVEEALVSDHGILSKNGTTRLSKLDSFMKESQRLNPPSACKCLSSELLLRLDEADPYEQYRSIESLCAPTPYRMVQYYRKHAI